MAGAAYLPLLDHAGPIYCKVPGPAISVAVVSLIYRLHAQLQWRTGTHQPVSFNGVLDQSTCIGRIDRSIGIAVQHDQRNCAFT